MSWNEDTGGTAAPNVDQELTLKEGGKFVVKASDGTDLLRIDNDTKNIHFKGGFNKKTETEGTTGITITDTDVDSGTEPGSAWIRANSEENYFTNLRTKKISDGDTIDNNASDNQSIAFNTTEINLTSNSTKFTASTPGDIKYAPTTYGSGSRPPYTFFHGSHSTSTLKEAQSYYMTHQTITTTWACSISTHSINTWTAIHDANKTYGTGTDPSVGLNWSPGDITNNFDSIFNFPLGAVPNIYRIEYFLDKTKTPTNDDCSVEVALMTTRLSSVGDTADNILTGSNHPVQFLEKGGKQLWNNTTNTANQIYVGALDRLHSPSEELTSLFTGATMPEMTTNNDGGLSNMAVIIPIFRQGTNVSSNIQRYTLTCRLYYRIAVI